jgi:hypothetical protein
MDVSLFPEEDSYLQEKTDLETILSLSTITPTVPSMQKLPQLRSAARLLRMQLSM